MPRRSRLKTADHFLEDWNKVVQVVEIMRSSMIDTFTDDIGQLDFSRSAMGCVVFSFQLWFLLQTLALPSSQLWIIRSGMSSRGAAKKFLRAVELQAQRQQKKRFVSKGNSSSQSPNFAWHCLQVFCGWTKTDCHNSGSSSTKLPWASGKAQPSSEPEPLNSNFRFLFEDIRELNVFVSQSTSLWLSPGVPTSKGPERVPDCSCRNVISRTM